MPQLSRPAASRPVPDSGERMPATADRPSGFDTFYAATAPGVVRQLYAMTGDLPEAQDCVQEAYARAWQRWSKVGGYDAPEAWVRTVAWRLAVSRFRRAQHGTGLLRRQGAAAPVPEIGPERVALVAALRQISVDQRRAIVLHHLGGLSVEEVAREMGRPEGTVKTWLARGRAALAVLLHEPTEGGHL